MPRMDPLRNTLDHLALDPAAQDDRRYLASMLRRLGYTEREIEEALGGEAARVIEVEYRPGRPQPQAGQFTVVQDEAWDDAPEPVQEVGFSVARDDDPALAHGWLPVDAQPGGQPVEFEQRSEPGWAEVEEWPESTEDSAPAAWPEHDEPQEEPEWTDDESATMQDEAWATEQEPWASEPEEPAEPVAEPEGATQQATDSWASEPAIDAWAAADEAYPSEPEEATEADTAELPAPDWADAPVDAWAQPESEEAWETPEATWDEEDEAAWAEVAAADEPPAWTRTPEPQLDWADPKDYAVTDAPAGAWSPQPTEPFTYGEYTLHTRLVELGPDREQRIYFFAKGEPKSGEPCPLPEGYVVDENDRTGLPFLRREAQTSDNCLAITQAGTQCRNPARDTSKYCAVHHGWRGAKALSQTS